MKLSSHKLALSAAYVISNDNFTTVIGYPRSANVFTWKNFIFRWQEDISTMCLFLRRQKVALATKPLFVVIIVWISYTVVPLYSSTSMSGNSMAMPNDNRRAQPRFSRNLILPKSR